MFERLFGPGTQSKLIDSAFQDLSQMLSQSERMLDHAVSALLENTELAVDLEEMDDRVDESERMVRRSVLQHLAINPQQDLVASLVLASIIQDAERIGDFASGLGELVTLARSQREGAFRDRLLEAVVRIRPLFHLCEEAFRKDEPEKAREVMAEHRAIKEQLRFYVSDVADSDLTADMAVVYSEAAHMLRRISAHLSNIASSVVQPYDRIRSGDEMA